MIAMPPRLQKRVGEWEQIELSRMFHAALPETERQALVKAWIGRGRFKENVFPHETQCRITRVRNPFI